MSRRQRVTTALILAPLPILALLFLPTPWLAALVAAVLLALCQRRNMLAAAKESEATDGAAATPPAPLAQALFDPTLSGSVVASLRQVLRLCFPWHEGGKA